MEVQSHQQTNAPATRGPTTMDLRRPTGVLVPVCSVDMRWQGAHAEALALGDMLRTAQRTPVHRAGKERRLQSNQKRGGPRVSSRHCTRALAESNRPKKGDRDAGAYEIVLPPPQHLPPQEKAPRCYLSTTSPTQRGNTPWGRRRTALLRWRALPSRCPRGRWAVYRTGEGERSGRAKEWTTTRKRCSTNRAQAQHDSQGTHAQLRAADE
eukprot:1157404-Pelagomonas_calceolata.AAC.2